MSPPPRREVGGAESQIHNFVPHKYGKGPQGNSTDEISIHHFLKKYVIFRKRLKAVDTR